jgi:hypothetical protein
MLTVDVSLDVSLGVSLGGWHQPVSVTPWQGGGLTLWGVGNMDGVLGRSLPSVDSALAAGEWLVV